ncbi:MAG: hypothetical protein SynsKO_15630 [Synoicihabitans sp.]
MTFHSERAPGWFVNCSGELYPQIEGVAKQRQFDSQKLAEAFPDEPWKWRKEWQGGVVKGTARQEAALMGGMAVVFIAVSIPATLAIPDELEKGNYPILLVLIFTLVGVIAAIAALRRWLHFRRFGRLSLQLDPFPGSWGGWVGGIIRIPRGAQVNGDAEFRLQCQRLVESGSGKNRRRRETVLWETEQRQPASKVGGMGMAKEIPVRFLVERGKGRPSSAESDRDYIEWKLSITLPVRRSRKPLRMEFPVPVFDLGDALAEASALSAEEKTENLAAQNQALARAGGKREWVGGEDVWIFHQPSAKKHSLALFLFGGIFGAVAWWVPFLPIQLAFGGFALLFAMIIPGILWHRSELRIRDDSVLVRKRSWRGWKAWAIHCDEIAKLELSESMRSGKTRFMRLVAVGVEGVDPENPHPAEHFKARKARFRYQRETRNGGDLSDATVEAILETPCFEIELAGYLLGTRAAEDVRDLLAKRLGIEPS